MSWSHLFRQAHRWVSVVFTLAVLANIVAISINQDAVPPWITYAPLPFLFVLLVSGAYLFVLPFAMRGRSKQQS